MIGEVGSNMNNKGQALIEFVLNLPLLASIFIFDSLLDRAS